MTRSGPGKPSREFSAFKIHRAFDICCEKNRDFFREVSVIQFLQGFERLLVRAFVFERIGMKNRAAADRDRGRELPDDKCIAVKTEHRRIQPELRVPGFPWI